MRYKVDYVVVSSITEVESYVAFEADNDVEALYKADKITEDMTKKNKEMGTDVSFKKVGVSRIEQVEEQEMQCLYLISRNGSVTEQWFSPEEKENECSDSKTIAVAVCTSKEFDEFAPEEMETYRKTAFEKLSALEREKKKSKIQERD